MRVAIATVQVPFIRGGAELLAEGLCRALRDAGHTAEIIAIPFKWYPAAAIPPQMLACRLLDLTESMGTRIDRLIGLKFPAYLIAHPHKVLWLLHQHRPAYDLWEHHWGGLYGAPGGLEARDAIRNADAKLIPEAQRLFAISRNVARRLDESCGAAAQVLYHPPPLADRYFSAEAADYLLMPSRINGTKRQELVIEALALTRRAVRVLFIGEADNPAHAAELRARAEALAPRRTEWLGAVTDERKLRLMAEALAVIVPPFDEDYGYVTLEAMLASRAVITCTDSGGPLEFVEPGRTGLVCEPKAAALADAMDRLWIDRAWTHALGQEGLQRYRELGLSWQGVVQCLLG